jgi:hypothetical protein
MPTEPTKTKRATFTVKETEDTITKGAATWDANFRDRLNYERSTVLTQAINAWRVNPIARRIIELTTEFVLGDGFGWQTKHPRVQREIEKFWNHPLNDLDAQLPEWADEAWRTGDLFLLFSVDEGSTPYVRALPSELIQKIETKDNDYRQEVLYSEGGIDPKTYPAYDPAQEQLTFVLHFPLKRAAGATFGESDLAPVLYWISLYRQWLEDRARLNHTAALFTYVLQKSFSNPKEQEEYATQISAKMPKKPGSLLVLNDNESLGTITAGLNAFDGNTDGLALKKMIATGVGLPVHYLAEPESSTRTTAEASGTPTFKHFKSRQVYLRRVVTAVITAALQVRGRVNDHIPAAPDFEITTPDVSERDNATLAIGAQRIVNAFAPLYNARHITAAELIRLVYRFIAETPPEDVKETGVPINTRGGGKLPDPPPEDAPPEDEKAPDPNA